MVYHLKPVLGLPYEREHEGWLMRGIEDYAASLQLKLQSRAIGPTEEKIWPADESLDFQSKIFGLQLKRPYLKGRHVRWGINQTSVQHQLVRENPEIFYALPTFVNRSLRRQALHHCLFWRPCEFCSDPTKRPSPLSGDYQSEEDLVSCNCIGPMRWASFVEKLYRCDLVKLSGAGSTLNSHIERLIAALKATKSDPPIRGRENTQDNEDNETLLLLALEITGI